MGRALTRTVDGPRYWLVDEVSAVTDWSAVVKDLRDNTDLRHECVVLTGSSARQLRDATKNLAGRRGGVADSDRLLLPMRFRDFCRAINLTAPETQLFEPHDLMAPVAQQTFDELEVWTMELTQAWESYLQVGGFPRAVRDFLFNGDVQPDFLTDIGDVIRGEAIRSTSISDTELIAFLARLNESVATPLNASAVARDIGLGSHHQVNDRVNDLVFALLAWQVFQNNEGHPNVRARRKAYFTYPVISRVPSYLNNRYAAPDDTRLSEQQFGLHLARAVEHQRRGSFLGGDGVLYERTASGNEIDFVGPDLGVPIESKYVDSAWKRDAQTIHASYVSGVIATRSIYDTTGSVWAVPTALIALVLAL